jgi:hypothetical protein
MLAAGELMGGGIRLCELPLRPVIKAANSYHHKKINSMKDKRYEVVLD